MEGKNLTLKRNNTIRVQFTHRQKEIANWIQRCLPEVKISDDLIGDLKDGTILCKLMNKLQPGSIPPTIKPETMGFKQMQNVEFFLKACRAYGAQLDFSPDDLVNSKDPVKVIGAIHYLGEIAESKGFEPSMEHLDGENAVPQTKKRRNSLKRVVEDTKKEKRRSIEKIGFESADDVNHFISKCEDIVTRLLKLLRVYNPAEDDSQLSRTMNDLVYAVSSKIMLLETVEHRNRLNKNLTDLVKNFKVGLSLEDMDGVEESASVVLELIKVAGAETIKQIEKEFNLQKLSKAVIGALKQDPINTADVSAQASELIKFVSSGINWLSSEQLKPQIDTLQNSLEDLKKQQNQQSIKAVNVAVRSLLNLVHDSAANPLPVSPSLSSIPQSPPPPIPLPVISIPVSPTPTIQDVPDESKGSLSPRSKIQRSTTENHLIKNRSLSVAHQSFDLNTGEGTTKKRTSSFSFKKKENEKLTPLGKGIEAKKRANDLFKREQKEIQDKEKTPTKVTIQESVDVIPEKVPEKKEVLSILDLKDKWTINFEEVEIVNQLSAGSSGEVYLGFYLGTTVAIKWIPVRDEIEKQNVEREYSLMRDLNHPNIVQFLGMSRGDSGGVFFLSEFVENGDLFDLINFDSGKLNWRNRTFIALQLSQSLYYLHTRSIIHRDIKSQNILMADNFKIKLCDFGLATSFDAPREKRIIGSELWFAPEIASGQTEYDELIDVFSFGIVLTELILTELPQKRFPEDGFRFDVNYFLDHTPLECPDDFTLIVLESTQLESAKRPPFKQIMHRLKAILKSIDEAQAQAKAKQEEEMLAQQEAEMLAQQEEAERENQEE